MPKLESSEATAVLYALAALISTDIAALEARHASNREMSLLRSRGWWPSVQTLSAKFIGRTFQALRLVRALFVEKKPRKKRASKNEAKKKK